MQQMPRNDESFSSLSRMLRSDIHLYTNNHSQLLPAGSAINVTQSTDQCTERITTTEKLLQVLTLGGSKKTRVLQLKSSTLNKVAQAVLLVKALRPTRHEIGHFGDVRKSQSLGLLWKKQNLT